MAVSAGLIARIGAEISPLQRALKTAERDLQTFANKAGRIGDALSTGISAPLAVIGGAALKAAGDIESLSLALDSAFKNQGRTIEESRAELEKLRISAKAPGLDFEQAVRGSIRLQSVKFSAEKARKTIEELANAVAASGGSAQNFESITNQFTQIIGKGKLLQEDISIILENAPALAAVFQDAFGASTASQIAATGVTAREFVDTTIAGLSKLDRVQGGIANAFVNLQAELKNSLAIIGLEINKAFDVKSIIENVAERISKIAQAFKNLSPETKKTIIEIGLLVAAIGPVIKLTSLAATGFAALASPVGLVVAAIAALAAAFIYAYNNSEKFRAAIAGATAAVLEFWKIFGENIQRFAKAFSAFAEGNIGQGFKELAKAFIVNNPVAAAIQGGQRLGEAYSKGFSDKFNKDILAKVGKAFPRGRLGGLAQTGGEAPVKLDVFKGGNVPGVSSKTLQELKKELIGIDNIAGLFGTAAEEVIQQKIDAITSAIEKLIKDGVKPASNAIKGLIAEIKNLRGATPAAPDLLPTSALPGGVSSIDPFAGIAGGDPEGLRGQVDALNSAMEQSGNILTANQSKALFLKEAFMALADGITNVLQGAIEDLSAGFGDALGSIIAGTATGANIAAIAFEGLISILQKVGQIAIKVGAAFFGIQTLFKNPLSSGAALGLIATGAGLIALAALLKGTFGKSIPALADGGIVRSPTLALIGERGPEAVVPLPQLSDFGGESTLSTRVSGDDLYLIYQRAARRKGRIG